MGKKVMLGMSGGVDSSAAAKILKDDGYEVTGITLQLFNAEDTVYSEKCPALSNIEDAKRVAKKLGIEHIVVSFRDEFKEKVMKKFCDEYFYGRTPNPCIECNKFLKFGKMLETAEEMGFDYIATGHYALKEFDEVSGRFILKRPKDRSKDQTYVLYNLTQHQLEHILFPLYSYEKSDIRKIAEGLIEGEKPDSQDICFVPEGKYTEFIEKFSGKSSVEGDFIDTDGKVLGTHKGIINYTVGQRKGLGIALGKPAFVIEKDTENNTVTLGDENDLMKQEVNAENINLISVEKITEPMRVTAKTRYNQKEQNATVIQTGENTFKVVFDSPQRAVTPGQAIVLYNGDILVGGGTII